MISKTLVFIVIESTMCNGSLLVILLTLFVLDIVNAECPENKSEFQNEARLFKNLTCAYNSDYRPVKDHKSAVNVKLRFDFKYMTFDTSKETITLHTWVLFNWQDELLTWNASDYGGVNEILVHSYKIWTPPVVLFNTDASLYQPYIYTMCLLTNEGIVTCVPSLAYTAICSMRLGRWPYDEQNCTFLFGSFMRSEEQVNLTFSETMPVVLDEFQNAPGWKLLKVDHERLPGKNTCCPNNTDPMLKFTFLLRREAAGLAVIVIVPSIVIVLLTLSSLLLDVKSNTRLVMMCFNLFNHFAFIIEIGYLVPKLSPDTPIILLFIRDSMIVTLIGILETLLLMSLTRKVVPAPTWIVSFYRFVTRGPGKYIVFTEFDPYGAHIEGQLVTEEGSAGDEGKRIDMDWIKFANLINSCVFIISFIVYLLLICINIPI